MHEMALKVFGRIRLGPNGCWLWTGSTNGRYGHIRLQKKLRRVHRIAYEFCIGPIGNNEIDHLCNNKLCLNPEHLEAVTGFENRRRQHQRDPRNYFRLGKAHP
jgi:hypothetical protein